MAASPKVIERQTWSNTQKLSHSPISANLALANHNYQDTLEAYASALKIARELERSRLVAVLFNRMGSVLQVKGEIQDAAIRL